ncbi:hypothetical protein ACJ73_00137 [Blastomyces percursus]|uniref:Ataxin-2 C-terminal domain-containing protein n=1 Tax=Blastomyces percursus TaxID=1658174 RepID=A0A1J9QK46_9EURO|nr:hypothetical protein ACJ73_00137 [Blastomyces percursus]
MGSMNYFIDYMLTPGAQIQADLGSARREYISTVDDAPNKYRHVGLDQIEAMRAANMKGSKVQKLAEANKTLLSGWNNAHKTIGGDVQLEDLDSMMSGQSHRAQLCDLIKAKGGQEYIHDPIAPPKGPSRSTQPPRRSRGTTRGGGVVGSCGRGNFLRTAFGPQNTPSPCVLGSGGGHAAESTPDRRRCLDPARSKADEDFPKRDTKIGKVGVAPRTTKSDRGSRGRGRLGTVKTRRVVDPSTNSKAMLADPSDFLAVAKVHHASGPSDPPKPTWNAATQSMTQSDQPKQASIAKDEAVIREKAPHNGVLEGSIKKGAETRKDEDTIGTTLANELQFKGTILPEQAAKSTTGNTWAIQVDSLPFDGIGTRQTDFGELKTDKRFRSSLPQPIHTSEESTLLIDLMRKSRSPSNPAPSIRPRHMDSGTNMAPMSSILTNTPPSMRMLLPEVPTSSAGAEIVGNSQTRTSNGALKCALDLLIDRLQRELDQVSQIIEDTPWPVESTDIRTYLLNRKQQLESEIAEVIEMESDIVLPFSTLSLEDPFHKQPNKEDNVSEERPILETLVVSMDKKEVAPLIPGPEPTLMSSGQPDVVPQQVLLMSNHTPPIPPPTSSTFTNSVYDIIGDHLLPGRNPSSITSDLETPKVLSGNGSLYGFSTPPAAHATGGAKSATHATAAFSHCSSINQLQVRDTPNIPDNATTRQYMESASDTSKRSAEPRNLPLNGQQNHPLLTATQQFSISAIHPPKQSGQPPSPISYMTAVVQSPVAPSQSKPAPQAAPCVSSPGLWVLPESSEQIKPIAQNVAPKFPMSAATMQYSGALFQRQGQNAVPKSPDITTPFCHNPPGGPRKPSPASVPRFPLSAATLKYSGEISNANIQAIGAPPRRAGQEGRNPSTASSTRKNSETSASSSINPPQLSGLENSKWATPADAPTSPKGATTSSGIRKEEERTMEESTTNSGPSKRQRESPGLANSKWAS